jgi:hypothetical protein
MYVKDDNGIPTGYYIQERDYRKFYKAKKAFAKRMLEKYGPVKEITDDNKALLARE